MDPTPEPAPTADTPRTTGTSDVALPELPASAATLTGRVTVGPAAPSLTSDRRAADVLAPLDGLVQRAVDGATRDEAPRILARGAAVVLAVLFAVRVLFDGAFTTLLLATVGVAAAVAVVALALQAYAEARRQRALLVALAQLSRMARLDPAMRERVAPQVEAVVDALRAQPGVLGLLAARGKQP